MVYELTLAEQLEGVHPQPGDVARVLGRCRPGDGQWLYRWEEGCTLPANGGTVWGAGPRGRWRLSHEGTVGMQVFGVFGPQTPADDALDALVHDPEVHTVRVSTDVNFTKRHTFFRSGIILDFTGHRVTADGVETAAHNDPFGGILQFCGRTGECCSLTLAQPVPEQYDILPVPDSSRFPLYSWWRVSVNNLSGREEKELDHLLCVTQVMDAGHVRVNYKLGWLLAAGRVLTWQAVEPVEQVCIRNMTFWGNKGGEGPGAHPVVFQYAVRCNVEDIHAWHTYWPVIMRRHNTEYTTLRCSLANPTEVVVGGTGYLTQQIHCLYGAVRDCTTSNARHLNDFTSSAYCMVENCHGDGDFHGAFVTHGQFEHDLTYVGNSGLLSFANSGPTWGSSAKRITVVRHTGCWALGFAKISDLTLQDVAVHKTEKYPDCGTFLMNADGLQMRGCTGEKLVLTQRSRRSSRPVVIRDCHFRRGVEIRREGDGAVERDLAITMENITQEKGETG